MYNCLFKTLLLINAIIGCVQCRRLGELGGERLDTHTLSETLEYATA